jgi:cytidylate kinase
MNIVTIDGPSGSGKGTISRKVAQALGYALLDSGALYRISGLKALKLGLNLADEGALVEMLKSTDIRFESAGEQTVTMLDGDDVSKAIREERVGMAASEIAPLPGLRAALLQRQRDFASVSGLVADGRDMGTVVFPKAKSKIFLTASSTERAKRRVLQLQQAGVENIDEAKILEDIEARDARDRNRSSSPLVPAKDALILDSTQLSIEEVFDATMSHIQGNT